ncbi:MAG: 1-(5-phosphoribosyl)-5-[(5-phosphoribosylamino)methylideneamino]imidazole-4-carboxamide isomerase [Alphaproteobacteria bacterium]|nr:1-(5-phosphoribosyl)-5-[(5-phosphoribosylamino)methylideneamino]imidazole-4-carboxamide isomerase [Alphaproteobacteria bacterium]
MKNMEIFPAIDLQGGKCVRLKQGDFDAATIYGDDPLLVARGFEAAGARWMHVVDLDGAKAGKIRQLEIITKIAGHAGLRLQVGGGVRAASDVEALLAAGAGRVVVGSLAVKNVDEVKNWITRFGPERVVLAFDVRMDKNNVPEILTHGWQASSSLSLWDVMDVYKNSGLKTVLCTDVSRDGMLVGTNLELYKALRDRFMHIDVLASGGVNGEGDLKALSYMGVAGAIVGKAIYEGKIDLAAAIKTLNG